MILGFSTKINNKPSYFVEKISLGIDKHLGVYHTENFLKEYKKRFTSDSSININSKIHTIREDKTDRWKAGKNIDFFINVRTKKMFRFAPVLPVVSTQKVYMSYKSNDLIQITVGNKELSWHHERLEFAQNDGFDTWEDFFDYFYPQIKATPDNFLKMKLIHWTDKRY